jgi:predicted transcriptional regulator
MADKKKSFILLSLDEKRLKKILDHLAEKGSATETEISNSLALPISTVHYNLKNLVESTLVSANEFHYSEKGKEVIHYSLSNKYIVIAPKGDEKTESEIRSTLFATAVVALGAAAIWFLPKIRGSFASNSKMLYAAESAGSGAADAAAPMLLAKAAPAAAESAASNPAFWPWFLAGGIFAILAFAIINAIVRSRNQ